MEAQTIAQIIASALNIAATLLPKLEEIQAADQDNGDLAELYLTLKSQADGVADQARALLKPAD